MSRPVLPEWRGEELEYVEPTQVVRSFGYDVFAAEVSNESMKWFEQTIGTVFKVEGEVASQQAPFANPEESAQAVKRAAENLGAAMVGITALQRRNVYKGMNVPHAHAILIAVPMDYDEMRHGATERHVREVAHIYAEVGRIASGVAEFIRGRGYDARPHSLRFEQINMIPHAIAAGLGELGKHGSLINRRLGCSFRLSAVTTDFPMTYDAPVDEGIQDVCVSCQMCTRYCPGEAISDEKETVRGALKWVVDTEKCAPYWGSYYSCGICLEVCPFNAGSHGGRYKQIFRDTIKAIDLEAWKGGLAAGLQNPWEYVEPPKSSPPGWRNNVRGRGSAAALMQGIPSEGLPRPVYDIRSLMGCRPQGDPDV